MRKYNDCVCWDSPEARYLSVTVTINRSAGEMGFLLHILSSESTDQHDSTGHRSRYIRRKQMKYSQLTISRKYWKLLFLVRIQFLSSKNFCILFWFLDISYKASDEVLRLLVPWYLTETACCGWNYCTTVWLLHNSMAYSSHTTIRSLWKPNFTVRYFLYCVCVCYIYCYIYFRYLSLRGKQNRFKGNAWRGNIVYF